MEETQPPTRPIWASIARGFAGIGCLVLLVILAPGMLLGTLFWLGAERTVFERARSPDGWREARVQFDDAGAITGFARVVFVRSRLVPLDTPWLSCRAFWGSGEAPVRLSWPDNRTLLVRHGFSADQVEDVAERCGSIRIVTRPLTPPAPQAPPRAPGDR